ncbi:BON domain-containing protein [Diaphorobacter sp. C33]|uniref:BON domain-containing protein n=1 Tax=Diaphorobacter nitroreducens TaxID=164759 RepID=A0AAX1WS84_9BURK|nr:BON domain-containing protein [Diaphorobacter sp. C33]ROR41351.1 BON domain-containing protein [Diaphorobacter nitroreducens]WKK90375.1 BON domain-containing protein [Diaphorobacter sp. C33]
MTTPLFRTSRWTVFAAAAALAAGLSACNKAEEPTAGQRLDSAINKTEQAAQDAKQKMESAAQEAGQASRNATADAAALMDDAGITTKVNAGLAQDPDLSAIKIDVDTRAGVVTLNGPVKSEQARDRASQIAQAVPGVTSVVNNLTISSGG